MVSRSRVSVLALMLSSAWPMASPTLEKPFSDDPVQAPENRLTPCAPVQAYAQLYSSCSGLKGEDGRFDAFHATLERVVGAVPGYVLECRADRAAAEVCSEGIRQDRERRKL